MELKQKEKNNGSNLHQPDVDTHTLSRRHKVQLLLNSKRWLTTDQSSSAKKKCPTKKAQNAWWHCEFCHLRWSVVCYHAKFSMLLPPRSHQTHLLQLQKAAQRFPSSSASAIAFNLNSASYEALLSAWRRTLTLMLTCRKIKWNGQKRRHKHRCEVNKTLNCY